jgi:lipopolysaccharide/colanic/teichoic acid biosynthesis glycosyltransferase
MPGFDPKRPIDVVAAAIGLTLLSPVIAVTAVAVRLCLGSPVLFRQVRPGLHGKPFLLVKFRTMTDAVDSAGALLGDRERLTRFGRLLRASSLDELPQLWNVLKGEMSLVGPRPLLMEYLERYSTAQARRHEVRPGLTGWAQVNGRNATSWSERLRLDVWYVDHRNFLLDLKILGRTAAAIARPKGISAQGHDTMPLFLGDAPLDGQDPADTRQAEGPGGPLGPN